MTHSRRAPLEVWTESLRDECRRIVASVKNSDTARRCLPRLKELGDCFPDEVEPNLSYALVREQTRVRDCMLDTWTAVHERFPDCARALQYRVRWLAREHRSDEARALIERIYPGAPDQVSELLTKADLLIESRDTESANEIFEQLLRDYPDDARSRASYARRLKERGDGIRALEILAPVRGRADCPTSGVRLANELDAAIGVLRRRMPGCCEPGVNVSSLAVRAAI